MNSNSATTGLRVSVKLAGSITPGLSTKLPDSFQVFAAVASLVPSTRLTRSGLYKYPTRILAPGAPPFVLFTGATSVHAYVGPSAAMIAAIRRS